VTLGYRTTSGPERGPFKGRESQGAAIGVIDENSGRPGPVGVALPADQDGDGVRLWKLVLDGVVLTGRWVIIDRRFRPVE
jgi:hypothetical protein